MILIDYSQVIISTMMAESGFKRGSSIEKNLLRHMIINVLRSYKKKFGAEYGEMIIACDGKNYWRRQYFPYYKANRKKERDASGFDWQVVFDTMTEVKQDIIKYFPYRVVDIEGAEADDVIAAICFWAQKNYVQESLFDVAPKPIIIVSGDGDFVQLQRFSNVKQYSPILKKFMKPTMPIEHIVLEHVIKGDFNDGVPNVLSSDDCIATGTRQKSVSSKKLELWLNSPEAMPQDDAFKRNYTRNSVLVDLTKIPEAIQTDIIESLLSQPKKDRSMLMNYFMRHGMKNMLDVIGDF